MQLVNFCVFVEDGGAVDRPAMLIYPSSVRLWPHIVLSRILGKSLLLEEKVLNAVKRMRRIIRRCLWQMKADAVPMRQRVLQALALQNDYAEL